MRKQCRTDCAHPFTHYGRAITYKCCSHTMHPTLSSLHSNHSSAHVSLNLPLIPIFQRQASSAHQHARKHLVPNRRRGVRWYHLRQPTDQLVRTLHVQKFFWKQFVNNDGRSWYNKGCGSGYAGSVYPGQGGIEGGPYGSVSAAFINSGNYPCGSNEDSYSKCLDLWA